jgi:rhomboid family GlyGly-CTERM serine protease
MKIRLPWLTVAVACAVVVLHLLPSAAAWLQFDRTALAGGELWRLLTGHLVHFGGNHLAWDVAVFVALGFACERQSRTRCVLALAFAAATITPAVWLVQPQFTLYRGLSGLDCALFGLLAASLLRYRRPFATALGLIALAGFAAKCLFELTTAQTVFAAGTGYAPVPLAHLVGLLAGCAIAFIPVSRRVAHSPDSILSADIGDPTLRVAFRPLASIRVPLWLRKSLQRPAPSLPNPSASACAVSAKTTSRASISTSPSAATLPSPA